MKVVYVYLQSTDEIKALVNTINKYDFDVDLSSDRYFVDGKSLLGVLSLDHSKPVKMEIHTDDYTQFLEEIKQYIVEENT